MKPCTGQHLHPEQLPFEIHSLLVISCSTNPARNQSAVCLSAVNTTTARSCTYKPTCPSNGIARIYPLIASPLAAKKVSRALAPAPRRNRCPTSSTQVDFLFRGRAKASNRADVSAEMSGESEGRERADSARVTARDQSRRAMATVRSSDNSDRARASRSLLAFASDEGDGELAARASSAIQSCGRGGSFSRLKAVEVRWKQGRVSSGWDGDKQSYVSCCPHALAAFVFSLALFASPSCKLFCDLTELTKKGLLVRGCLCSVNMRLLSVSNFKDVCHA